VAVGKRRIVWLGRTIACYGAVDGSIQRLERVREAFVVPGREAGRFATLGIE
jgi:hypothetical protein